MKTPKPIYRPRQYAGRTARSSSGLWEVEWQPSPGTRWRALLWADVGFRFQAGEIFQVSSVLQANQAVARLKERLPEATVRVLAPGAEWWQERCSQCGSSYQVLAVPDLGRLCAQCRGVETDA